MAKSRNRSKNYSFTSHKVVFLTIIDPTDINSNGKGGRA